MIALDTGWHYGDTTTPRAPQPPFILTSPPLASPPLSLPNTLLGMLCQPPLTGASPPVTAACPLLVEAVQSGDVPKFNLFWHRFLPPFICQPNRLWAIMCSSVLHVWSVLHSVWKCLCARSLYRRPLLQKACKHGCFLLWSCLHHTVKGVFRDNTRLTIWITVTAAFLLQGRNGDESEKEIGVTQQTSGLSFENTNKVFKVDWVKCMCTQVNVSKYLHVHVHERAHRARPLQAGMCHLFVLSVLMWTRPATRRAVTDQQTDPCYPTHFHLLSPYFLPPRLPAFSTGIIYPLLSRHHLWHMEC